MKVTIDLDDAIATISNSIDVQLSSVKTALVLLDGNGDITLLDGDAKKKLLDKAARNIIQALIVYDLDDKDDDTRVVTCGVPA